MPYKKSPASFMKHKSKAVGYMAKGSAFHLDTDPSPERQARLDKMKAEREAARAIKRKEYDAKRQAVLEKQMKKSIEEDIARNIRRQAIIEKRKQKDPSYKLKQKQIVTGQQHLQAGTTPLEMHGPGGTHPDTKLENEFKKQMSSYKKAQREKTADSLSTIIPQGKEAAKRIYSYNITPPTYDKKNKKIKSGSITGEALYFPKGINLSGSGYGGSTYQQVEEIERLKGRHQQKKRDAMIKSLNIYSGRTTSEILGKKK